MKPCVPSLMFGSSLREKIRYGQLLDTLMSSPRSLYGYGSPLTILLNIAVLRMPNFLGSESDDQLNTALRMAALPLNPSSPSDVMVS